MVYPDRNEISGQRAFPVHLFPGVGGSVIAVVGAAVGVRARSVLGGIGGVIAPVGVGAGGGRGVVASRTLFCRVGERDTADAECNCHGRSQECFLHKASY